MWFSVFFLKITCLGVVTAEMFQNSHKQDANKIPSNRMDVMQKMTETFDEVGVALTLWLRVCVCVYRYIHMCVCVCIYIYMCVYIYAHTWLVDVNQQMCNNWSACLSFYYSHVLSYQWLLAILIRSFWIKRVQGCKLWNVQNYYELVYFQDADWESFFTDITTCVSMYLSAKKEAEKWSCWH